VETFIRQLCAEAANRLAAGGAMAAHGPALTKAACAQQITLKLKKRKPDSKPQKYLGHGPCDNLSRSLRLAVPVSAAIDIANTAIELYHRAGVAPADVRGVGVHLSELTFSEPASSHPKPEKRARVSASPSPPIPRVIVQVPSVITPPDARAMSSAAALAAYAEAVVESQPLETIRAFLCELRRSEASDNQCSVSEAIQRAVQAYWGFALHCWPNIANIKV
jgi:hypothetical protein